MSANLKWCIAVALPAVQAEFTESELLSGWPELLTHAQCAALQCAPALLSDIGPYLLEATRTALAFACVDGDLPYLEEVEGVVPWAYACPSSKEDWEGKVGAPEYEGRLGFLIEPCAFSLWLASQGVPPSEHVQAWFDACGVHHEPVPVRPVAQSSEAVEVQDWPSLVRYRAKFSLFPHQQRPQWLPRHVALVMQRKKQEEDAGKGSGVVGRLAEDLGISRQALSEIIRKHTEAEAKAAASAVWVGLSKARGVAG